MLNSETAGIARAMPGSFPTAPKALSDQQIKEYNERGFVIARGFFDKDELTPLRYAIDADPTISGSEQGTLDSEGNLWNTSVSQQVDNSYLGCLPRLERMIASADALLGEEAYFWHIKLVRKGADNTGKVDWHQDYPFWYETCLYPKMVTCSVAVDECTRGNGCMKLVPGSQHMGRFDFDAKMKPVLIADQKRVSKVLELTGEPEYAEMEPGDTLFFHPLVLHASDRSTNGRRRALVHCTYNARSNEPIILEGQEHRYYREMERLPDNYLRDGLFSSVFSDHAFFDNKSLNVVDGKLVY